MARRKASWSCWRSRDTGLSITLGARQWIWLPAVADLVGERIAARPDADAQSIGTAILSPGDGSAVEAGARGQWVNRRNCCLKNGNTLNGNPEAAADILARMAVQGTHRSGQLRLALAPLNHLARLPIDVVKLSPKLIAAATGRAHGLMLESLIQLAKQWHAGDCAGNRDRAATGNAEPHGLNWARPLSPCSGACAGHYWRLGRWPLAAEA